MKLYLQAKHWQLFLIFIGIIMLSRTIFMDRELGHYVVIVSTIVFALAWFGWLVSIAQACYKTLPSNLASSPRIMIIGILYALTYFVFGSIFLFTPGEPMPAYGAVLHILGMVAVFYSLGFTAKQLVKLDQNKDVSFFSYSGPFFMFWFFPFGIWFLQPKVNQLLGAKDA